MRLVYNDHIIISNTIIYITFKNECQVKRKILFSYVRSGSIQKNPPIGGVKIGFVTVSVASGDGERCTIDSKRL